MKPHYDLNRFAFMRPQGPHMPVTESYVVIPPALVIRDSENALWTLGFDRGATWRTGEYEFDVIRNGVKTGEHACRIEYRRGKVRIFGEAGWRSWNGRMFV
jgi:hypothetical protein